MVCFHRGLLLFAALFGPATAAAVAVADRQTPSSAQQILGNKNEVVPTQKTPRKLKGRFLHITGMCIWPHGDCELTNQLADLHPDPFYKIGTDPYGDHPCHRGRGGSAVGKYGAATTGCDSPLALVNATFEWIDHNIKDEIDFVVWTGDSARHDNDDDIPRTYHSVEQLNELMVSKFVEVFGKSDNINDPDPTNDFVIPIVPTYGNNDILPHNIFEPGPNRWTRRYLDIWARFVPEEQKHSFARGGWFFTEVIPDKLAVFSLNTLYFFDNNAAVDGCDLRSEPGYEHMEWLRIQLQFLRDRKMKAILTGHVPPARTESKQSWDETCYQKYTLWLRQYRDVIVANMFGHMNIDHFMFHDVRDLRYKFKIRGIDDEGLHQRGQDSPPASNGSVGVMAKATYINELRAGWAKLPTPPKKVKLELNKDKDSERHKFLNEIGGEWAERFSLSVVSPSVVPNYFPTLRIIEYNITGLEHNHPAVGRPQGTPAEDDYLANHAGQQDEFLADEDHAEDGTEEDTQADTGIEKNRNKHKKKKGKKKPARPDFPVPRPPSKSTPPGPAFSPQTFTFMSWTQLYANLTHIHRQMESKSHTSQGPNDKPTEPEGELEPEWLINARARAQNNRPMTGHKDDDKYFDYKLEYTTCNDSVYRLPDLTVRSWIDLAERIGRTNYKMSPDTELGQTEEDVEENEHDQKEEKEEEEIDPDVDVDKKKKKKKKKHKKPRGTGHLRKNKLWHTFVTRVFVQTKSEADLLDDFD